MPRAHLGCNQDLNPIDEIGIEKAPVSVSSALDQQILDPSCRQITENVLDRDAVGTGTHRHHLCPTASQRLG